jgi:hypothetical protein
VKRPIRSRGLLAIVVVAAIALPAARARGEAESRPNRRRVLLLVETPGDPFMARIRAEIASLNLDVVVRAPQGSIETNARAERAVAAIRMLPSRNGVEVWMADETSGRSLLRQAIVDETPGGPNQNLIALQTAELLRTSLFPRPAPETPPSSPPQPPAVIMKVAPTSSSGDSGLRTGVGLLYGAGGASSAWQAWLSFHHLWTRRLGMGVTVGAPLQRGTMAAREGTAEVGAIVAGPELLARFESEGRQLFVTTGLGAAFVAVLATGSPVAEASAQLVSQAATAYTALAYARVDGGFRVASWLSVGASALAGSTVAPVRVRFAGNDAGRWGVPVLGATLFGQLEWN